MGSGLSNGSDVTAVFLAGFPVTRIVTQDANAVLVVPGQPVNATAPVTGDVVVISVTRGNTSLAGSFTYAARACLSLLLFAMMLTACLCPCSW